MILHKVFPLDHFYSFNGEGLYKAKAQGRGTKLGNSRHKMWDDLTSRIERDF